MKFKWFILLLLSFYLTSDQAFSQQTFQRAYGGSGNDYGKSVIQIYDGNYLIVGETTSSGAGVRDVFVMKIDTAGNLLWSNTYGGTGDEDLASGDLLQTADSGFIILGRTKSFGASGWDIYCVKLDSVGTIVWENRYGGNVTDNGDGIYPTHDGGYIITSSQTSYTVGSNDISLLKIDGSGNLKWTKTYGASSADHPGKIRRTSDSGFFIVGNTLSFGLGSRVAFLIRIDSLGNKLWHKVYNGGQDEGLMTLELTLDGGVIMLGSTKSGGAGNWDMFLIKADSAGNVLWAKSYGGSGIDRGIRIITEPNGDYTIAGHSESVGNGSRDLILMRIDSVGTAIWTRAYGTSQFEEAGWWSSMMAKTNDGGYIMTGTTTGFSNGDQEIYVVKTDKNGFAGCNEVCVTFTEGTPTIVATSPALSLDTTFARFSMSNVVSQFTLNDSLACFTNNAFKYDTTICLGASAQLITAGGDTYSWSPGGTLNDSTIVNPIATPSTTTVYVVLVTDTQCNAVDTGIFTVNVSVPPNFGLVDGTICIGDSITWTASGVQSYWWAELSKPNDTISVLAGLSVSPSVMTSYIITGTDSSSCTWKDTVTVDVNTLPIVNSSVTPDTVCLNDSSIFTATGAQSYTWAKLDSPAVTISILSSWQTTFDSTTSLIVTGTDTNNCVNYDTVTLVVNPLPLADSIIGSPFICPFDDSIDYSINIITVGSTYDWGVVNGTITYGQGTDSIKVAWDSTGSALVTCIETNFFGCVGDTLFFLVNINVLWTPPAPFGPDTLCAAESDSITYSAIFTFKANYYWHIQGGTILSGDSTWQVVVRWDTIGTGYLTYDEENITIDTVCFNPSDTLWVTINPSPTTKLILGDFQVCVNDSGFIYLVSDSVGATYIWSLKGGTIVSGDSTSVITVKWDSAGTWGMSVFEINQFGCVGDTIDTIVNVYMNPIVDEIMGDTIICGLDSLGKSYWVTGNAGATYEWIISGGTIVSGQSNDTIAVDWFPPGFGTLNVIEQSADSCFSDTFSIDIVLDNSNIIMEVVSDKYVDDEDIRIKWSLANGIHFNGTYYLSRKPKDPDSSWVLIATTTTTSFLDEDQLTSTKSYDYKVTGIDKCGDTIGTARHNSILLEGTMEEQLREVQLNWNHYINWPLGVDYYEIWRKLDDETDYTYYGSSGTDSLIMYTNGADGYDHCYRILAFEKGDTTTSWSNKLCLSFDHLLNIPNAFSPNGDGVNDTWVIENLDLYPENSLYIYNRWGNLIYHVANYKNTWRGMRESRDPLSHGLPDGNYYYIFSIITDDENIQTTYHGTVLIFR